VCRLIGFSSRLVPHKLQHTLYNIILYYWNSHNNNMISKYTRTALWPRVQKMCARDVRRCCAYRETSTRYERESKHARTRLNIYCVCTLYGSTTGGGGGRVCRTRIYSVLSQHYIYGSYSIICSIHNVTLYNNICYIKGIYVYIYNITTQLLLLM